LLWSPQSKAFSSVTQLCPTLCDPLDWSTPGFRVLYQLLDLAQTHVHQVSDAIQPSHPLSSPSPRAFNLSQHQGLFKWVSSFQQVAKVLEFQLQHRELSTVLNTSHLVTHLILTSTHEMGTITIPTLQIMKGMPREVQKLSQTHTSGNW